MYQTMKHQLLTLILLYTFSAYGQNRMQKRVDFNNIDGFSGYTTFSMLYRAPDGRMHGKDAKLTITNYNISAEEIQALNKAGLNIKNHAPSNFGIVVEGKAIHYRRIDGATGYFSAPAKLHLNNGSDDYTNVEFGAEAKQAQKAHFQQYKTSLWEQSGEFRDIKVTTLYLTDLKNEINRILGDYKRQQEGFANAINNGTQYTNEFSFEVAESYLNSAKSFSNGGSEHRNKISELEKLIAAKKSEKEETEKKERQEAGSKKVSSSTGGGSSESGGNSDDAEEESTSKNSSSQKKYIPKTATQMHNELK